MNRPIPPEVLAEWAQKANPLSPAETQGNGIPTMEVVLLAACFIIVSLRVYIRVFQTKSFGWDDALVIFSLVPLTGMAISLYLALSRYGWDRHIYDVPPDMLQNTRKMGLLIQLFYLVSTSATKLSILLFYRRLTDRVSTRFRYILFATIAIVASACVAGVLVHLVGCRPLKAYWMAGDPTWLAANKHTCYNEAHYIVFMATFSMVTDFVVCILPLSLFIKLHMHWRQKLALAAIFGAGFFLCFCGIMRMVKIIRTFYGSYDLTWSTMEVWIWTGIEAHFAVIIASLPALNHFFRKILKESSISDRFKSVTQGRRYGSRYGSGYNKTANSTLNHTEASDKAVIHVTQEIHLEESKRQSRRESKMSHKVDIDEVAMKKDRRAWLDETSDDDDSLQRQAVK